MTNTDKLPDLRSAPVYERNPFLRNYGADTPKWILGTDEKHLLIDKRTGEPTLERAVIVSRKAHDREPFIKLYAKAIAEVADLSKNALRLFMVLLHQASHNQNEHKLHITYQLAERALAGFTRSSFQRAMRELMHKHIIGKTPINGLWWINPDILFNGNRLEIRQVHIRRNDDSKQIDIEDYISDQTAEDPEQ